MKIRSKRGHPHLKVENFGPIRCADVHFGNLTAFVGPQATGKSILLQLLKLLVDARHVKSELRRAGIDWEDKLALFLDVYFGEGMHGLWKNGRTSIEFNENSINLPDLIQRTKASRGESMFFVPAQRVLTLRDGWPQAFTHYDAGVPFTVREFSEELRLLMSKFGTSGDLFPVPRRLKEEFRDLIQQHIFPGFNLKVDTQRAQKRLVLAAGKNSLPFMVWSAGQREFVPLLLGLYYLLTPAGASRRRGVDWAIIEELEMGLHPRAIGVVVLMLFELAARGYRVCVSTHSPQVLDAIWALKHLVKARARPESLLKVFDAPATQSMMQIAERIMKKIEARVYYFERESAQTRDISNLNPSSDEAAEAGWGGLSEFSGRANEVVARAVANAGREAAS
ncbi:MAG: AAA family ATPase [Verrucomicrobiae bacterium]|nr:AAA family ATPase [Verrucomicrobiae bacterium]